MRFLTIKNKDTEKLGAVILWEDTGRVFFTASTKWYQGALEVLLSPSSFKIEVPVDDKTIGKEVVQKKSPKYLDVVKTKILPPYIPYVLGDVEKKAGLRPTEAIEKIWEMFSTTGHQEIQEA